MPGGILHVVEAHLCQIRQGKRIAATKAKVGSVWYSLQFFLRIPKGSCDVCMGIDSIGSISAVSGFDGATSVSFVDSCRNVGCLKILAHVHGLTDSVATKG